MLLFSSNSSFGGGSEVVLRRTRPHMGPSSSKAPGISYQGRPTMKTSVGMLKTSGGLQLLYAASFCVFMCFCWAPEGFFFFHNRFACQLQRAEFLRKGSHEGPLF